MDHLLSLLIGMIVLSSFQDFASAFGYSDMPTFPPARYNFARFLPLQPHGMENGAILFHHPLSHFGREARKVNGPQSQLRHRKPVVTRLKNGLDIRLSLPVGNDGRDVTKDLFGSNGLISSLLLGQGEQNGKHTFSKFEQNNNHHTKIQKHEQSFTRDVLNIKFLSNFTSFDPRNPDSLFIFPTIESTLGLIQDNAAFLVDSKKSVVNMASVPFSRWLPQNLGIAAGLAAYDAAAQLKDPIKIKQDNTLAATLRFRCRSVNTGRSNKFPSEAITNPEDDPRLGACGLSLADLGETGIHFSILLTNKGVWAKYGRSALARALLNTTYDAFEVYRRIASRAHVNDLVSARIEIDSGRLKQTRYYVDDKLVWTVGSWGVLSKDLFPKGNKFNRLVSYSASTGLDSVRRAVSEPGRFSLLVENVKKLDEADPNRFDDSDGGQYSPALVRVVDIPNYYDSNVQFYDEKSLRFSSLYGQGVMMGLHSLLVQIKRSNDTAIQSNNNHQNRKNQQQRQHEHHTSEDDTRAPDELDFSTNGDLQDRI